MRVFHTITALGDTAHLTACLGQLDHENRFCRDFMPDDRQKIGLPHDVTLDIEKIRYSTSVSSA
jgi:hypothetical protein